MTLTIHPDVIQGTDSWHDQRRGILTASVIGKLITPKTVKPANNPESRSLTMQLVAERITGWTEIGYLSDAMLRGLDDEPIARDLYAQHYAPVKELGFMTEDRFGFKLGYSPDGLVGEDGLLEIKSRGPKAQLATVLEDSPPIENMAQLQTGLLVSGREWIDYVSFCGGMALYVKRVYPQQKWFDAITEAATTFEENAAVMVRTYQRLTANLHKTERRIIQEMTI